MWGEYSDGALGLGDLGKLPARPPRGHAEKERVRTKAQEPVSNVAVPTEVRFDHHERSKGEGRVERYCFAVAADARHTAALVVDLVGDETLPESRKQYS